MSFEELLNRLRKDDIELWLEGERLRYTGEENVITPDILAELKKHKIEIIAHLKKEP